METPKNTKNTTTPYKQAIYDTYATWKSIPASMRQNRASKTVLELAEDPRFKDLLDINTQTEFAERYGVEHSTLSNWNKLIRKQGPMSEVRAWGQNLTKNLIWNLYTHCMKTGDPKGMELFLRVVADWAPPRKTKSSDIGQFSPIKDVVFVGIK